MEKTAAVKAPVSKTKTNRLAECEKLHNTSTLQKESTKHEVKKLSKVSPNSKGGAN